MVLIECLLATMLIVLPAGAKATYENPSFGGICAATRGYTKAHMFVNQDHQLIVRYAFTQYEIPIPPFEGSFEVEYILGMSVARVRKVAVPADAARLGEQEVDGQWSKVVVRYGPIGDS